MTGEDLNVWWLESPGGFFTYMSGICSGVVEGCAQPGWSPGKPVCRFPFSLKLLTGQGLDFKKEGGESKSHASYREVSEEEHPKISRQSR